MMNLVKKLGDTMVDPIHTTGGIVDFYPRESKPGLKKYKL